MLKKMLLFTAVAIFLRGQAEAQVVQLPSMHTFATDSSVLVPDYGGAYLAGVSRASQGGTSRGIPGAGPLGRNRGFGSSSGASGISVHATIIDHAELDERVLAEAKTVRGASGKFVRATDSTIEPATTSPPTGRVASLAGIRKELAEEDARLEAEAEQVFQKGFTCEEKKEWRLARTYYLLAAQKSPLVIKQKAQAQLAAMQRKMTAGNALK